MMDDAWDLHAVVRGCTTTAAVAANATTVEDYDDKLESLVTGDESNPFKFLTLCSNVGGGLEDVYKAGCRQQPFAAAVTMGVHGGGFCHQQLPILTDSHSTDQSIHPRKKKNQEKVFQLTHEELNNDLWAWRKNGQKSIERSPFPRSYYKCSTTKACGAKKQVERSLKDSTIFIVSYSGEHIHPLPTRRNSQAGTSRSNKFNTEVINHHPPCSTSSPASTSRFSPTASFMEGEYEINEEEYD